MNLTTWSLLCVVTTACSSSRDPGDGPDDSSPIGRYQIVTTVAMEATKSPGFAVRGQFFDLLIDTKKRAELLCTETAAAIADAELRATIAAACTGTLVQRLDDKVFQLMPLLTTDLATISKAVFEEPSQAYHAFAFDSQLDIAAAGGGFVAEHRAPEFTIVVGGTPHTFAVTDLGSAVNITTDIGVTVRGATFELAEHDVYVPFGALLRAVIDRVAVPTVDATAHDLHELFAHRIDCDLVADIIVTDTKAGTLAELATACRTGAPKIPDTVYEPLDTLEAAVTDLRIHATLSIADEVSGAWTGELIDHATLRVPLTTATFAGTRE